MSANIVIARAMGNEPMRRLAMQERAACVWIANPASIGRVESGETSPVGFPAHDVFMHDEVAYERLRATWEAEEPTDELWSGLTPYSGSSARRDG